MKAKFFLKILLILLVFVILGYDFGTDSNSNVRTTIDNKNVGSDICFNISVLKSDYLECEPIWLTADVIINKKMKLDYGPVLHPSNDLKFILRNSKGDTLKYVGGILDAMISIDYPDTLFFFDDLLSYFGEYDKFPNSALVRQYYLPAGQYSLTAVLHLRIGGEPRLFNSNEISFQVNQPYGEELEAYNKLLELQKISSDPARNLNEVNESVEKFIRLYPNSAYLEKARFIMTLAGKLPEDKTDFFKNLILNDLNNGYIESYLHSLRYFYELEGKQTQFKEFLEITKNLHANTLFNKIVRFKIKNQ